MKKNQECKGGTYSTSDSRLAGPRFWPVSSSTRSCVTTAAFEELGHSGTDSSANFVVVFFFLIGCDALGELVWLILPYAQVADWLCLCVPAAVIAVSTVYANMGVHSGALLKMTIPSSFPVIDACTHTNTVPFGLYFIVKSYCVNTVITREHPGKITVTTRCPYLSTSTRTVIGVDKSCRIDSHG